jgi:hypothetical protein
VSIEPAIWTKQPYEERMLEFDAADSLASGDSVSSIVGITVWEGAVDKSATMVSGAPSLVGNKAYAKIIAGTTGHSYWIRIRLLTANGDKIEEDLRLLVREIGG